MPTDGQENMSFSCIYKGAPLYKWAKYTLFSAAPLFYHEIYEKSTFFWILSDLNRWVFNIFSICKKQNDRQGIYFPDSLSLGDSYATQHMNSIFLCFDAGGTVLKNCILGQPDF